MYIRSIFVNKMWFVALFAFVMLVTVSHAIARGVDEILEDQAYAQARIEELLR